MTSPTAPGTVVPPAIATPDLPEPRDSDDTDLSAATRALADALDAVEAATARRPDVALLSSAIPDCVRVAGMLAALTGSLGELANTLAEHAAAPLVDPTGTALLDVAADLATMRALLHRATLVAAPAVADLRRCRFELLKGGLP